MNEERFSDANQEDVHLRDATLRTVLDTLPTLDRQALMLVYFRRHTQRQAAATLSMSQRDVAAALSRALQAIAARIVSS